MKLLQGSSSLIAYHQCQLTVFVGCFVVESTYINFDWLEGKVNAKEIEMFIQQLGRMINWIHHDLILLKSSTMPAFFLSQTSSLIISPLSALRWFEKRGEPCIENRAVFIFASSTKSLIYYSTPISPTHFQLLSLHNKTITKENFHFNGVSRSVW